ncbi:hypothetical protein BD413DRAFT_573425 [Trametes elegans]|nr:hypothetical protein BD413DRAFT_573425 [Trametes elegans]
MAGTRRSSFSSFPLRRLIAASAAPRRFHKYVRRGACMRGGAGLAWEDARCARGLAHPLAPPSPPACATPRLSSPGTTLAPRNGGRASSLPRCFCSRAWSQGTPPGQGVAICLCEAACSLLASLSDSRGLLSPIQCYGGVYRRPAAELSHRRTPGGSPLVCNRVCSGSHRRRRCNWKL